MPTAEQLVCAEEPLKPGQTNRALQEQGYNQKGFGKYCTERMNGVNAGLEDSFFNAIDADHEIKVEKPWHRRAVDLAIHGHTIKEICEMVGHGRGQVETVMRQPWAQARMIEQSKRSVQEEMREFLEAQVMPTLQKLVVIRDSAPKASDQISAGKELLERFLGKSVQPVVQAKDATTMNNTELAAEAARIIERERQSDSPGVPSASENPQQS